LRADLIELVVDLLVVLRRLVQLVQAALELRDCRVEIAAQALFRQLPGHRQIEHGDALAEHALAPAAVDQASRLTAAVALDLLHQRFALAEKALGQAQQLGRLFAIRLGQGQLAILMPGLRGVFQRLADNIVGGVLVEQLGVLLDAGNAAVELAGGKIDAGIGADHQVTLGDALAEHALHAGAVDRLGVADGGLAGQAGGQQAE